MINRSQTARSAAARARAGTSAPSYRLRYAWQVDRGGGNRRDYDVTLIVLDVNEKGEGEDQIALGVRLEYEPEGKRLVIENFGSEPVRLNNVRRR